jgi:hypothetical protein
MMHYVSLILYIIQVQKNVDLININHMYNFLIDIIVERFPLFSFMRVFMWYNNNTPADFDRFVFPPL